MAGFKILKTKKIRPAKSNVSVKLDKEVDHRFRILAEKNGQTKSIAVCEVKGGYLIIDGSKNFETLKSIGIKKILCYNFGKLSEGECEALRVMQNFHQTRLDNIGIAKIIEKSGKKLSVESIATKTAMPVELVDRYLKLLTFDWEEYLKEDINPQTNPFEDER